MSNFNIFDNCLKQEMSSDYWNDEESSYAGEVILSFNPLDWEELEQSWENRSDIWKERCALLLDIKGNQNAFEILKKMLQEDNMEIIGEVLESLQSFPNESKSTINFELLESKIINSQASDGYKTSMLTSIKNIKSKL